MIKTLKQKINKKTDPTYTAWKNVLDSANKRLSQEPSVPNHWYVPGFYTDPDAHKSAKVSLMSDANGTYELALAYQITGKLKYAKHAAKIIATWSNNLETIDTIDDSKLTFCYHFPAMIFAASLIRSSSEWSEKNEYDFISFLKDKALKLNTMEMNNNWGNWGMVLVMASAVYLDNTKLFQKSIIRWKELIENQIDTNGHLPLEVHRNEGKRGIWYSHFTLQPQTIAAEIARINGVYLYDYVSPNGNTLEHAYNEIVNWTVEPETFPYYDGPVKDLLYVTHMEDNDYLTLQNEYPSSMSYFEILNNFFNNKKAEQLLKDLRPLTSVHSLPHLTFTHGNLKSTD